MAGKTIQSAENSTKMVILLVTNLDEDDFKAVADSLEMKDRLFLVSDRSSIRAYKKRDFSYIVDSFRSPESVISRIKLWQKKNRKDFTGIIGLDEEHHYRFSSAIAREFSLEYYDSRTIDLCSNKYLQRKRLHENGVDVPKFQLLTSPDPSIGFPNVLKLLTGYASCYVYLNNSMREFKKNWAELGKMAKRAEKDPMLASHSSFERAFDPRHEFIVEEYIDGNEYSCDYVVRNGRANVLRVVRKYSSRFGFFDALYLFNPDSPGSSGSEFSIKGLEDVCRKAASSLGIKRGVCMMDFMVKDGKIFVIETTIRPGISTFVNLMSTLYKTTSIDIFMKELLGSTKAFQIPKGQEKNGLVVYISAPALGRITLFDTKHFEENWHSLGVLEICKYLNTTKTIRTLRQRLQLGYIMLKDVSQEDIPDIIRLVREKTIIEVESEKAEKMKDGWKDD